MISTDNTLLGQAGIGDAVSRHQQYAQQVERLDILVLTKGLKQPNQIAPNCQVVPLNFWGHRKKSQKFYEKYHYDLIVCQDPFITGSLGVQLKKKFGPKLIIHFHGDFLDNPYWLQENFRHRVYKKMAEKTIYQADSIRVVSEGIKQKLIKRGVAEHNIYKISTPVNLVKFETEPTNEPRSKKIVLTVSRIVKSKDFPTLVKTANQVYQSVPDFEWQIIGDGPLLRKFQSATKHQPYLKWLGRIDHDQLVNYYRQATVLVLTSTNESFGKVFLEAAMSRLPAVSTDTVGAQEIIFDGESGYLVSIGDWQSLAERIVYFLKNQSVAKNFGQRAYEIVKANFDYAKNIELIIQMWRQTVGGQ